MEIKIRHHGSTVNIRMIDPSDEKEYLNLGLTKGQSIKLTAINAHEPSDIEVGPTETEEGGN